MSTLITRVAGSLITSTDPQHVTVHLKSEAGTDIVAYRQDTSAVDATWSTPRDLLLHAMDRITLGALNPEGLPIIPIRQPIIAESSPEEHEHEWLLLRTATAAAPLGISIHSCDCGEVLGWGCALGEEWWS